VSFDDIFALLLFIVFIGLPLLNRMQQRGRPGAPPPGQGRPGAPGRPPGAGGQAGRPAGGGAAAGERAAREREAEATGESKASTSERRSDDDPFAELAKRLEEARRRVRDASAAGGASAGTTAPAARTIATPAPPSAAIPDPRAGAPRAPRAPRDPFPKGRQKPAAPWQDRSLSRASLSDDAPALEVERVRPVSSGSDRRTREVARMQARDLVALDAQSFRKGIMWHMVLSGPVAYRGRRKPSRPASR
jgi:hypothetical protein